MDDSDLKIGTATTSHGALYFLMDRDPRTFTRPIVIILHGALRNSDNLRGWYPVLSKHFDLLFVDLPGHGRTPADGEPTIRAFTDRVREMILRHFSDREIVAVGESVGGLVALGLANGRTPGLKAVIAADPPLSTAKQWPIYGNFTRRARENPIGDYLMTFMFNTFGYTPQGIDGDRVYYSMVSAVKIPARILTGDSPLFPVRSQPVIPCLMDEVDRFLIRSLKNPHVSMDIIPGKGHLCLDADHEPARRAVSTFCAEHLLTQTAGAES
ncbi:MAG: alpha/beta fold hydrolase [Hyphomicrobium zavarzinii]|jgi:pimeloyl-ACP methyl ester carboxylesterase|uniref:alpha/beta fold hydrolase n=1 Tax=Hyphomicrobium zavarzinii TaxID=48292 RepID=UPI0012EC8471|nr:alpha/beta fold hydrolase [Hyphomicrobium zavarzinii]MBL8844740.1 alpha/beta fold hydrolase [Hyphomicrobium zavarzinii]